SDYREVVVLDRDGRVVGELRTAGHVGAIRFSPDSRVLAAAAGDLHRWDTAAWEPLPGLLGPEEGCTALAFSPEGTMLAVACGTLGWRHRLPAHQKGFQVRLLDAAGAKLGELTGPTSQVTAIAVSRG